jgi:hypothetical protein
MGGKYYRHVIGDHCPGASLMCRGRAHADRFHDRQAEEENARRRESAVKGTAPEREEEVHATVRARQRTIAMTISNADGNLEFEIMSVETLCTMCARSSFVEQCGKCVGA